MDIASKIKRKRNELNLTQQDLAEKVFVTRQTISKWELGKSRPDLISMKLLEKELAIDLTQDESANLSKGAKKVQKKIQFKDIIFTLLFGLFFFPLRVLFTLFEKYQSSSFLVYLIKPAFIALFIYFIGSIESESLSSIVFITIGFYFALVLYREG